MEMESNPYAAPRSQVLQATSQHEIIRTEHINTEASLKSIGCLYYLIMVVLIAVGGSLFISTTTEKAGGLLPGALLVLLGVGVGIVGFRLRDLQSWARIPTIIISSLAIIYGLINLSLGVIIHIYILAKVMGKQGRFVMTPEYHRIIAATPHVKRKTSIIMKIALALLFLILLGIIISVSLSQMKQY